MTKGRHHQRDRQNDRECKDLRGGFGHARDCNIRRVATSIHWGGADVALSARIVSGWDLADNPAAPAFVRYWSNSEHYSALALNGPVYRSSDGKAAVKIVPPRLRIP
jgi:hypothetical protein